MILKPARPKYSKSGEVMVTLLVFLRSLPAMSKTGRATTFLFSVFIASKLLLSEILFRF